MSGGTSKSDVVEQADVVVVGGGQAGLVAGYYLLHAGVPHVILDAGQRLGESWRRRWDSLELFTAARYSCLPELRFPGDPEHFPGKDEVADYLENYARTFELPVRLACQVTSLERANAGYRLDTTSGVYEAVQVIVATGAYQRPHIPQFASKLSADVAQLHTAEYRNPAQIRGDTVLVVGSANSGAGIAADLADTHHVHLSRGTRLPHVPRRILGRSMHWWADSLGFIAAPRASWRGRRPRGDVLIGPSLRQLARRRGIELVGRAVDTTGRIACFEDGQAIEVDAVVWATGYRAGYSWIRLPVLDEHGTPIHRRGVTNSPGLYFLGMPNQHSRGSSLIFWVKDDAAYIVEQVRKVRHREPHPRIGSDAQDDAHGALTTNDPCA